MRGPTCLSCGADFTHQRQRPRVRLDRWLAHELRSGWGSEVQIVGTKPTAWLTNTRPLDLFSSPGSPPVGWTGLDCPGPAHVTSRRTSRCRWRVLTARDQRIGWTLPQAVALTLKPTGIRRQTTGHSSLCQDGVQRAMPRVRSSRRPRSSLTRAGSHGSAGHVAKAHTGPGHVC
jgi:hypothetical protein